MVLSSLMKTELFSFLVGDDSKKLNKGTPGNNKFKQVTR